MQRRSDITGLRSLAVLPIVVFHAGVDTLGGGFVGVDIFFVISGFLITSIILSDIDQSRFSLLTFYHRRFIRIIPALLTVVGAALVFGCLTMLPHELQQLGSSAAASSLFAANIYFWQSADYFAAAAETMPLLHLWSLGVEEQFYIFYPLALLAIRSRAPTAMRPILIGLTIASLALGAVMTWSTPLAAFYLLPSRAWELSLGGLVATGCFPAHVGRRARELLAAAGLALIAAAIVLVRSDDLFPVPWAILPCLGTALVLAYAPGTWADRLLSLPPLRFIGDISYSLYLWHWPIITFYRLDTGAQLNLTETAILVALSIVAATATYVLIEQPFLRRFRSDRSMTRPVLAIGGTALAGTAAAALAIGLTADYWRDLTPEARLVASYSDYRERPDYPYQFRRGPCFRGEGDPFQPETCTHLAADRPNVLVLGDSHAAQYWRAISLRFPSANVLQATASGCRPLLTSSGEARCRQVVDHALGPLLATRRLAMVILAGRWRDGDLDALGPTIDHIQAAGARAVVIGPTIEYQGEFPNLLARAMMNGDPAGVAALRTPGLDRIDDDVQRVATAAGATYISVQAIVCPQGECRLIAPDGGPMELDYGHFTLSGSRWVVDRMQGL